MKILLRRSQKVGMLGKVSFVLQVRAELTAEEAANVKKYHLGNTMLYERLQIINPGSGLLGLASRLALKATNLTISVNELGFGKTVDCKDIVEMLAVEEQIKQAAETFRAVLGAASTFGGEEVIEYN